MKEFKFLHEKQKITYDSLIAVAALEYVHDYVTNRTSSGYKLRSDFGEFYLTETFYTAGALSRVIVTFFSTDEDLMITYHINIGNAYPFITHEEKNQL